MKQRRTSQGLNWSTNEVIAIVIAVVIITLALGIQVHRYNIDLADTPIGRVFGRQASNSVACDAEATAKLPTPCDVGGAWRLAFDDEFNGTSLNRSYWADKWTTDSMNNVQTDPNNVSISNGNLILTVSSDAGGALITTDPKLANPGFTFGTSSFVEARIYFPGNGAYVYNWPAFWAISGHDSPDGEIDIAEGTTVLSTYFHAISTSNNIGHPPGTWTGGWHTYALDREPGVDYIYWDGKLIQTFKTDDGDTPDFLIINNGIQGLSTAITGQKSQVKVDYVRVWQKQPSVL